MYLRAAGDEGINFVFDSNRLRTLAVLGRGDTDEAREEYNQIPFMSKQGAPVREEGLDERSVKRGVKAKRLKAALDENYLLKVLRL